MAPVKKLSKKEANIKMRPWITINILKDMNERDSILKQCSKEKDVAVKENLFKLYQSKRNKVISDIRNSKGDYYHNFFLENKSDIKKTWEGIKNIVNINKKQNVLPSKLRYKNCNFELDQDIANNFNDFFVNIGNSVENKIPTARKTFSAYMKKRNVDSLFANPVDED